MLVATNSNESKWLMFGFLQGRKALQFRTEDFQAIGRVDDKMQLRGVVGYTAFVGKACFIHAAGTDAHWLTKDLLRAAFDYPFNQIGLNALLATVGADNDRSLKLLKHLGFREVYRIPNGWTDEVDLVFTQLLRDECKWHTIQGQPHGLHS